jgi:hypothetical protein
MAVRYALFLREGKSRATTPLPENNTHMIDTRVDPGNHAVKPF